MASHKLQPEASRKAQTHKINGAPLNIDKVILLRHISTYMPCGARCGQQWKGEVLVQFLP